MYLYRKDYLIMIIIIIIIQLISHSSSTYVSVKMHFITKTFIKRSVFETIYSDLKRILNVCSKIAIS